jgi:hypothetical protein
MSIKEVFSALAEAGRLAETADNVEVDLAERSRINRIRRGVCAMRFESPGRCVNPAYICTG